MSVAVLRARAVVVFGVSGSGKSTIGAALAERLTFDFCDADDLHPAANIEKMRSGHPLDDDDRWPWLEAVGRRMSETLAEGRGIVVACSALKRVYRDILRASEPDTFFVFLDGTEDLIASRVHARTGSFMPPSLLTSQFDALEPLEGDEVGLRVDVAQDLDEIVEYTFDALVESP